MLMKKGYLVGSNLPSITGQNMHTVWLIYGIFEDLNYL